MAEENTSRVSGVGRVGDYLFGRNTLIGVASLMLLAISGYATWSGMNDFIIGVSTSPAASGRELPGGLSVSNEFLVIAIVVALTFLMWLALRESFRRGRGFKERAITFPLYFFLALWSVGFGYGFWWSLIAGEEATRTSLTSLQEDARDAAATVAARLDAVRIQLDNVVSWSETQMAREESSGGTCGVASGAGRGPLYNARRSVRDSVASLRDTITTSWINPVQGDLEQLRRTAARLEGETVAERQRRFEARASEVRGRARNIAARSNELGQSTASEMRALADSVSVAPGETGFSCYDPTLAQRLRQAADQADEPAVLDLPEAEFTEGPAGVANAVKNLWANIGDYLSGLVTFIATWGERTGLEGDTGDPITGRDLIALLATLGVDLGLFVLTVLNPPFVSFRASGPVTRQLREAIRTAIERAPGTSFDWVHGHIIHHGRASYFVIPNLYSVEPDNKEEELRAVAINQLAGVFDNLGLIRLVSPRQLRKLKAEEMRDSETDLTHIRKERVERLGLDDEARKAYLDRQPVRNHGLLSKAERALRIAGWSDAALRDFEIFRLVDTEDLTPLLIILNEAHGRGGRAKKQEGEAGTGASTHPA